MSLQMEGLVRFGRPTTGPGFEELSASVPPSNHPVGRVGGSALRHLNSDRGDGVTGARDGRQDRAPRPPHHTRAPRDKMTGAGPSARTDGPTDGQERRSANEGPADKGAERMGPAEKSPDTPTVKRRGEQAARPDRGLL